MEVYLTSYPVNAWQELRLLDCALILQQVLTVDN